MDTVSIIIPVYNSAAYLPACLDSVLSQTWPDTEIILVENGSTDESPRICAEYAGKNPQIRLLQGSRRGPGSARNEGLRAAQGHWILFADSDDICEPELVTRLMEAHKGKAETLTLCGIQVTDEHNNPTEVFQEAARVCDVKTYVSEILSKWQTNPIVGGVYCKLFDLNILKENNIAFEEDADYAEDFVFNMAYLRHIQTVVILPDLLYRYRRGRPGSVTDTNLKEADFAALWQRRRAVTRVYEETFAFFGLDETQSRDTAAFRAFQLTDMIQLAVRRSGNFRTFRRSMEALTEGQIKKEIPSGIPPKDQKSLNLLYTGKLRTLWLYERLRRRIRIIRGHQHW